MGSASQSPAEERVNPGDSQGKFHRTTVGVYHCDRPALSASESSVILIVFKDRFTIFPLRGNG